MATPKKAKATTARKRQEAKQAVSKAKRQGKQAPTTKTARRTPGVGGP